jgi:hypothetical protein
MIWLAVFPTLTVLNLALGGWLSTLTPVLRTFVLATIAVPIVIYGLMPHLHKLRVRILTRAAQPLNAAGPTAGSARPHSENPGSPTRRAAPAPRRIPAQNP